jgi:hypothetical protein
LKKVLDEKQEVSVFWVFHSSPLLGKTETVRYVFSNISTENVPQEVSVTEYWVEELDRAILESERRRSKLAKAGPLGTSAKVCRKRKR